MTEIECDYSTKEISESFIEDVSTVLDQLEDYVCIKKEVWEDIQKALESASAR
jgi:hypothetical protein